MRIKITVYILFFMMLTPIIITSASEFDNPKFTSTFDDDVPIWNNGDSWTYTASDFSVNFIYEGKKIIMNGRIDDFKWTVSDTSGSNYTVDIKAKITASYEIQIPLGGLVLELTGTLKPTLNQLKGTIIFGKANLEIKDFNLQILGVTSVLINPLPIRFPISIKITADADLSTPFPLFDFPLHILKFWNMPEIDITTQVNIGGAFGLFKIPITVNTHYNWIPFAFSCPYKESITVEAGNYEAWKIKSLIGGFFEYYYAPAVRNLVKINVNMPQGSIQAELKSIGKCCLESLDF